MDETSSDKIFIQYLEQEPETNELANRPQSN